MIILTCRYSSVKERMAVLSEVAGSNPIQPMVIPPEPKEISIPEAFQKAATPPSG